MKQVFVDGKGDIVVREVAPPELGANGILSQTAYSVISSGTETMGIRSRRNKPNPDGKDGPLGYTNSGTVIAVGKDVEGIEVGDKVGNYGSPSAFGGHVGTCHITRNLFVKLPESVNLREAAFTGLGGIAIQAVRRAGLTFGESAVVMGLGVLGQLIARVSSAAGYQVIATDLLDERLRIAEHAGIQTLNAGDNIIPAIQQATEGHGADAVLICAASESAEPISQALQMIRFGGRIVMVGVTKMKLDRSLFFAKEADFVISRAAGPGRYDPVYEGEGQDMPYSFVRWTEGRNLREFIRLIAEKRIQVTDLITHELPVDQAAGAYDLVLNRPQETLGVLLKY
ncbi:MAG: zinc-binding alcohol dehydrogenase [Armatimonadetes bacterium]|nr:zinc-binding alcohol dehydrogenase [Armatimonadota bacterium]